MTRLPPKITGLALAVAMFGLPASWAVAQAADPAAPVAPADPAAPAPAPADPAAPAPAPTDPAAPAPTPMPTDPAAPAPAPGDPAAAPPAAPAAPPAEAKADQSTEQNIENLFHYFLIGSDRLAAAEARQLVARPDDLQLLRAFERTAADRGLGQGTQMLLTFRGRANPKEVADAQQVTDALIAKLSKIRNAHVRDPKIIGENLDKLTGNALQQQNAIRDLSAAGEIAVPVMLDRLRDSQYQAQHAAILQAMARMRGTIIAPLVAATDMKDEALLVRVAEVLLAGNDTKAAPYLLQRLEDPTASAAVKGRLSSLLARAGVNPRNMKAGNGFYDLAEKFYYGTAGINADPTDPKARLWSWEEGKGLVYREVPQPVFTSVMAMRTAEQALKANGTGDAVSLWLAANNKREVETPEGAPPYPYSDLTAHYWNVRIGAQHLNQVLNRAMRDGNGQNAGLKPDQRSVHTQIVLKATKSLAEIVGQSNMAQSPLVEAMRYPDRAVRYEAALALAGGLPQRPFNGQDRVVMLLGEALAQTGMPGVLIFAPQPADVQKIAQGLKDKYRTAGGTNAAQVVAESAQLPSVDAILVAENVDQGELQKLFGIANQSARMDHSPKIIMVGSPGSQWFRAALGDQKLNATTAKPDQAAEMAAAIEAAKKRAGGVAVDEKAATEFGMRAAGTMGRLAVSRGQVLDLIAVEPTLLSALSDTRVDLAKAAAAVVGLLDSAKAQTALADKATDEKTADDVKVPLYKALATNVKFFAGRLDEPRIDTLRKAATTEKTPETKAAAAEALGALNLTSEQVKPLILDRPKADPAAAPAPTAAQ